MSGIVGSKLNVRGSGIVTKLGTDGQALTSSGVGVTAAFEDLAAGISWQTIETGSTMTAVAGNGYPIDTTSNACTITLPASASAGDEIIFTDYARNWGTNGIVIDSNGLNYQTQDDTYTVEYGTDGTTLHIVYSDATNGWIPILDEAVDDVPSKGNQEGIFSFGDKGVYGDTIVGMSNLVSNTGVVASDVSAVGTARKHLHACEYGGDKGIVGFGTTGSNVSITNLVSNAGVVASDQAATTGTARQNIAACSYGEDKGIFGFGGAPHTGVTNLVSNTGVVASDTAAVGTARYCQAACEYGGDKGIFGFGNDGSVCDITNLVSNAGVVASDVTGVGTARQYNAACSYGGGGSNKGIFGFGLAASATGVTNLVSNTGVVASDVAAVGTARYGLAACEYGGDKGIFSFAYDKTNLVSNTGVVASDVDGVGTKRYLLAGCSFN